MIKRALFTAVATAIIAASSTVSANPMIQLPVQQIVTPVSMEQLQKCVTASAISTNWTVLENRPGNLLLRYSRNPKWWVKVKVTYSEKEYRIDDVDSDGLNYRMKDGVPDIHRNYNRWIKNLNKYIQVNLSRL